MASKSRNPQSMPGGRPRRDSEHGGALVFVLLVAAAFMFAATLTIGVGLHSRRTNARKAQSKAAFYCAELALERARPIVAANENTWSGALSGSALAWHPVTGSCNTTSGVSVIRNFTYRATICDNADDADQQSDADSAIIVNAEVLNPAGVPVASITGVVQRGGNDMMEDYSHQAGGGARKTGNKL